MAISTSLVEFFVLPKFENARLIDRKHAELSVTAALLLAVWSALVGGVFYAVGDSPRAAMLMGGLVLVALATAVLVRQLGDLFAPGVALVLALCAGLAWLAAHTGGLSSPAASWLMLVPLAGVVFGGYRLFGAGLVLAVACWAGLHQTAPSLAQLEPWWTAEAAQNGRLIELVALGSMAGALVVGREQFIGWLIFSLRQVAAEARAIVNTAPDAILAAHEDGALFRYNEAATELFGYDGEHALRDMPITEVIPGLEGPNFDGSGEGADIPSTDDYVGVRADGSEFPIEVAGAVLDNRNDTVLVFRDITDRKAYEQELRDARDKALEANRAKSAFLANMSHELRTPLNAVIGYSEMLIEDVAYLDGEGGGDTEIAEGFVPDLKRIRLAGKHLLALVNDVLDLSKIEAGKMKIHVETIEIGRLLDDISSTIQPLANKNDNEFSTVVADDIGPLRTDLTKLRQILFNLLSNACKFTENGRVTLEASAADDGHLIFKVEDTGIGMDQEQLEEVFGAFTQADASTTREFGGTGLGLTITRHFCDMLEGDISVESAPGEGTCFTVRLPVDLEATPQEDDEQTPVFEDEPAVDEDERAEDTSSAEGDAAPDKGRDKDRAETVLVVDDDPNVRDLLRRTLEREGFEVACAASGPEGLMLARELGPVAITLDVMMPQMDGWDLLNKLKSDPELQPIPVIMVTMVSDRARGFSLGADHYLVKPIERRRLIEIVNEYRSGGSDRCVLVVEDDVPTRELVARMLSRDGWDVTLAENGQVGLDKLDELTPQLVVLDLMMPKMDGFEFLQHFRERPECRDIPVVVTTAKNLTEDDRRRLEMNVDTIMQKGARDQADLLDEVRKLVVSKASRQGAAESAGSPEPAGVE